MSPDGWHSIFYCANVSFDESSLRGRDRLVWLFVDLMSATKAVSFLIAANDNRRQSAP